MIGGGARPRLTVSPSHNRFDGWIAALEAKHLAQLTFPEVSRALRALSSAYVERREKLADGAALSGAGKRAAFALFYGPLHHILISAHRRTAAGRERERADARRSRLRHRRLRRRVGGCLRGAAAAPKSSAIDRHPWAIGEAAATYRAFAIPATVRQGDIAEHRPCRRGRSRSSRRSP